MKEGDRKREGTLYEGGRPEKEWLRGDGWTWMLSETRDCRERKCMTELCGGVYMVKHRNTHKSEPNGEEECHI